MGCIDWFLYGQVDYNRLSDRAREHVPVLAGALFGAGWWCWIDAVVVASLVFNEKFPITYHIPGWVATLALICMNIVSRDDLANMGGYLTSDDAGYETRAKIWLFFSYLMAFGSVAGSIAVLVACVQAKDHVEIGVGGLLQCGLILLAGLLFWSFRTNEDSSYGLVY